MSNEANTIDNLDSSKEATLVSKNEIASGTSISANSNTMIRTNGSKLDRSGGPRRS